MDVTIAIAARCPLVRWKLGELFFAALMPIVPKQKPVSCFHHFSMSAART